MLYFLEMYGFFEISVLSSYPILQLTLDKIQFKKSVNVNDLNNYSYAIQFQHTFRTWYINFIILETINSGYFFKKISNLSLIIQFSVSNNNIVIRCVQYYM